MSEDWHTTDTANEKIVPPMFFGSLRPKIWLRRCKDQIGKLAIGEFILNRRTNAEAPALENLKRILRRG